MTLTPGKRPVFDARTAKILASLRNAFSRRHRPVNASHCAAEAALEHAAGSIGVTESDWEAS